MHYLYIYLILLLHFLVWFFIAQKHKNNGLVDIAWGLGLIITTLAALAFGGSLSLPKIVISSAVLLWGLRLSGYLFIRNYNKPEDYRYQNMRNKWGPNVHRKALLKVFIPQSILNFIIGLPMIYTNLSNRVVLDYLGGGVLSLGIVLFIIGYLFEAIGDYQLKQFKKDAHNHGKILMSGLWQYTRHPNYFGEVLLWWGIGLMAIAQFEPLSFLTLVSPLLITVLILTVSGVPLLEKKYDSNAEYQLYKTKTAKFFPWFPKK